MELRAEKVNKVIRSKTILSNIDLELYGGTIYGIVGANGSGKTMLLRALSGLMSVTSGKVTWNGKVLRRDFSVLPSLGILLENVGLYPGLTGMENLKYLASLKNHIGDKEICRALERVGLNPEDKRTYKKYSLGMKQRLAIAQAIMETPDVIMLDEPTNSLDKDGREEIRQVILEEKERGAMVLLASHNEDDIQILADHIYIMEQGILTRQEGGKQ